MDTLADLTLGERIHLARTRAGLEQKDLAEAVHVSRSTISNWETGETQPTVAAWIAIARRCEADWMLRLDGGYGPTVTHRQLAFQPTLFDAELTVAA